MVDLDPNLFGDDQPCYGCSPTHPTGFRLRFTRDGDEVRTRFLPGENHQGPPGVMHGGLVTTLADEIAVWSSVGLLQKFGFTASLQGKLLRPVRIGVEVVGRGHVIKATTRTVRVGVKLEQTDVSAFEGEFVLALLDVKAAERLLGRAIPDAWRHFSR